MNQTEFISWLNGFLAGKIKEDELKTITDKFSTMVYSSYQFENSFPTGETKNSPIMFIPYTC